MKFPVEIVDARVSDWRKNDGTYDKLFTLEDKSPHGERMISMVDMVVPEELVPREDPAAFLKLVGKAGLLTLKELRVSGGRLKCSGVLVLTDAKK